MVVVCSLWRWSEIWVESAYLFIEIKAGPAVASKFVRQFLSNLVSTRPCHCFLVVAGGLVTKTKGCGICSFGGHETLENMVCHSCGDPVSFLVAEAISDFSIANDANVFRLLLFAQRNLEDGEGEQNSVKIHPKTPCFHWHFRKSDSSPPQFRIESLQP